MRGSGLPSRKLLTKALGGLRMMMLLSAVFVLQFSEVTALLLISVGGSLLASVIYDAIKRKLATKASQKNKDPLFSYLLLKSR